MADPALQIRSDEVFTIVLGNLPDNEDIRQALRLSLPGIASTLAARGALDAEVVLFDRAGNTIDCA